MNAFHSMWTSPFFCSHNEEFYIEDFELLTTILSALKWRQFNGKIKMITDKRGVKYYKDLGLDFLWDLGLDDSLENISSDINPKVFWAAGKLYALGMEASPSVMLDTDFIVWDNIDGIIDKDSICPIHREDILRDVYPNKDEFTMQEGYKWPDDLNWIVRPCNTSFLYINDYEFRQYYTNLAKEFMMSAKGQNELTYMVFAEQRLLSMCALLKGKPIQEVSSLDELFGNKQKIFTHIWGHKRALRSNEEILKSFCNRCMERIKIDFQDEYKIIKNIPTLTPYHVEKL